VRRTCDTCQKLRKDGKCAVLKENIGLQQECWAWTDDPYWLDKVNFQVKLYSEGWYSFAEEEDEYVTD